MWGRLLTCLFVPINNRRAGFAEVANIMWKAERQGRCLPEWGDAAVAALVQAGFRVFASAALLPSALRLARTHGRKVCDSLTADEKLASAIAGYLPVRWLGAL